MGQKVTIKVNGKAFGVTVNSEAEEQLFRKAASSVDNCIALRKEQFSNKSMEDLLTFVSFNECKTRLRSQMELEKIKKELAALNRQLEAYLDNTDK